MWAINIGERKLEYNGIVRALETSYITKTGQWAGHIYVTHFRHTKANMLRGVKAYELYKGLLC